MKRLLLFMLLFVSFATVSGEQSESIVNHIMDNAGYFGSSYYSESWIDSMDMNYYHIRAFGAECDSITDDTDAIQSACDAAYAFGGKVVGSGKSRITETIFIRSSADFSGAIWYVNDPTITAVCFVDSGGYDVNNKTVMFPTVYQECQLKGSVWHGSSVGIKIVNARTCDFHIPRIFRFKTGLLLTSYGKRGCALNRVYFHMIDRSKTGIKLSPSDKDGWVNANNIYGGEVRGLWGYNRIPGHIAIHLDSAFKQVTANVFNSVTVQSDMWQYFVLCAGTENTFNDCYFEATNYRLFPPVVKYLRATSYSHWGERNMFVGGYRADLIEFQESSIADRNGMISSSYVNLSANPALELSNSESSSLPAMVVINRTDRFKQRISKKYGVALAYDGVSVKNGKDRYDRIRMHRSGLIYFGSGNREPETYLYHSARKTISTAHNFKVNGNLFVSGTYPSDFAIKDKQPPLLEYWKKTMELNHLPAFEGKNRSNWGNYLSGLEETTERLLRYIVELEKRISELENR